MSKSHTCHITSFLLQHVIKMFYTLARMQAANVDTTGKQQAQQPAFHKSRPSDSIKVRWPKVESFASNFSPMLRTKNY